MAVGMTRLRGRRRLLVGSGLGALCIAGVVVVTVQPDTVSVGPVDTRDVLRTDTLPPNPMQVLVDGQAARAFILLTGYPMRLAIVDTRTGRLLQTVTLPHPVVLATVDEALGRLYLFGDNDRALSAQGGTLDVFDVQTGTIISTSALRVTLAGSSSSGPGTATPFTRWGPLVLTAAGTHLTLLTRHGGHVVYDVAVGMVARLLALDDRTGYTVVAGEGNAGSGAVAVLDTRTGRRLRTSQVGASPCALAVDEASGHVFVATGTSSTASASAPGGGSGTLDVLDAQTGGVVRAVSVGQGPYAVAVAPRTHRVFVLNMGSGSVTTVDAGTGHVVRTVALPAHPQALVVDDRAGRVFVANVGNVRQDLAGLHLYYSVGPAPLCLPRPPMNLSPGSGSVSVIDARSGRRLGTIRTGTNPTMLSNDERAGRVIVVSPVVAVIGRPPLQRVLSWLRTWVPGPWLPPPDNHYAYRYMPASDSVIDATH